MTFKTELAILRKIVALVKREQKHFQFPPRGGRCWCELCEAIRWYDEEKNKEIKQISDRVKALTLSN